MHGFRNDHIDWNVETIAMLTQMWADGKSSTQIALKIPNASRSAVIGKIRRLKLPEPENKISRRRQSYRGEPTPPRAENKPLDRAFDAVPLPATPDGRIRNITRLQAKANGHDPVAQPRAVIGAALGLSEQLKGEAPDGTGLKLVDLQATSCRWPRGNPQEANFEFCGRRSWEDLPYCADHSRIAYQPATERRRQLPRN
jgi:GcrA cell cycle regulator